jgi:hypothetical protein
MNASIESYTPNPNAAGAAQSHIVKAIALALVLGTPGFYSAAA